MEYLICGCIGYGLGCLNPAYFISKYKHQDIRNTGTGKEIPIRQFLCEHILRRG